MCGGPWPAAGAKQLKEASCCLHTIGPTWTPRRCDVSSPAAGASCSCCQAAESLTSTLFAHGTHWEHTEHEGERIGLQQVVVTAAAVQGCPNPNA